MDKQQDPDLDCFQFKFGYVIFFTGQIGFFYGGDGSESSQFQTRIRTFVHAMSR